MTIHAIEAMKNYAGKACELQLLRDRVEELERLLGLSQEKRDELFRLRLTPGRTAMLSLIYRGNLIRKEAALEAIYGARPECDQPDIKIIDVMLCAIRKRLKGYGITIENQHGIGWFMTPANKQKLRDLLDAGCI
jgi:two-component system cell cycle response regulator CtrA